LTGRYRTFIRNYIAANPRYAQIGGVPGPLQEVRAFLRAFLLKGSPTWPPELEVLPCMAKLRSWNVCFLIRQDVRQEFPIWSQLYYLIRCGETAAALELAKTFEQSNIMVR
jgi:hypothetical protein